MLKAAADGSWVYLKREYKGDAKKFEEEQKKAVFKLDGEEHQLQFDGKVDDVVLGKMSRAARSAAVKDIKELAPVLDEVEAAKPAMDKGETVAIEFPGHGTWKGTRKEADYKGKRDEAFDYVFTPAEPKRFQTAVFTDTGYVKLQTSAFGVRHEVTGKGYRDENSGGKHKDDTVFYISEMVGVGSGKKKGKTTEPATGAPPQPPKKKAEDNPDPSVPF